MWTARAGFAREDRWNENRGLVTKDSAGTRKAQAEAEAQTAHLHLGFEDVSMDPGALSPEVYVQETPFDFRRFSLLVLSDSWNQEEYLEEIKAGPRFGTQH